MGEQIEERQETQAQQVVLDKQGSYAKWLPVIKGFLSPLPVTSPVFQLQRIGVELQNQFDALFSLSVFACTPTNALGIHNQALAAVKLLPTSLGAPAGYRQDSLPISPALAEDFFRGQSAALDASSATLLS